MDFIALWIGRAVLVCSAVAASAFLLCLGMDYVWSQLKKLYGITELFFLLSKRQAFREFIKSKEARGE